MGGGVLRKRDPEVAGGCEGGSRVGARAPPGGGGDRLEGRGLGGKERSMIEGKNEDWEV